jgi:putative ABC transport system permease protein
MDHELILTSLQQGLTLTLIAYGIMIPFRLLNFPDLTAEGTYPFSGAICTYLLLNEIHPLFAIIITTIVSGLIGICAAYIHIRLNINTLLIGIILSTMLYSINLKILGKPNIALFEQPIIFTNTSTIINILILLSIIISLIIPLILFLQTELGLRLRAVGLNPLFAKSQGIPINKYTILGLFIANCFTGTAGSIMIQLQNYMDIGMGIGIVIHALASLMIGETILGNNNTNQQLMAPFLGALIYQQIQGLALAIGFASNDLKLLTGLIVLGIITVRQKKL